jgi:cellulose synthase/poly-beta-1,6-N-acetylglucosamine synthase-like glycosyltransferase
MSYWWILHIFDALLFAIVALTTVYLLFFSIASLFSKHSEVNKAKRMNRFIILIPAYRQDSVILHSVNSVLGQTYPQRLFDVVVISDHESEMTNMRLAQLPVTLLTPNFAVSTKAKSLQFAVLNLPQYKIYDAVLVLDADNVIEPEFLEQMNDAFEVAGTKVIQAHRLSKNRDTTAARLDAIFEEINTSIFRRGHISVGLSAAINGSGMVYDFEWFKNHIMKVHTQGEDKELEAMLMRESIFVDYFDTIHVYDEKTRKTDDFNRQRGRWVSTQLHSLLTNIRYLPSALFNRRYDHVDKIIQWLLIPRTILMGIILIMSIVLPFVYFTMAIKWWAIGALVMFAFALATPDYLVDKNWDRDFLCAPIVIMAGLFNIARAGRTEVHHRYNSLRRFYRRLIPQKHNRK